MMGRLKELVDENEHGLPSNINYPTVIRVGLDHDGYSSLCWRAVVLHNLSDWSYDTH